MPSGGEPCGGTDRRGKGGSKAESHPPIVVNHAVELTDEEKAEARQRAIRQYQDEELRKMQNRNKAKASQKTNAQQVELSLF